MEKYPIGYKFTTHQQIQATIIDRVRSREKSCNILIEFNDRHKTQKWVEGLKVKTKHIQDPSLICHYNKFIAYKEDIKINPLAYMKYRAMLDRCYGNQTGNNKTYKNCQVCDEWIQFENFVKWFNDNYYSIDNCSMDLDKDILGNGKLYSPDTCVFIPHKLNSQFARRKENKRLHSELPTGVFLHKRPSGAYCYRVTILPKKQLFENIQEAKQAYDSFVENQYKEFALKYKEIIPQKLYEVLINYHFEK